jgi:hypothetical protein
MKADIMWQAKGESPGGAGVMSEVVNLKRARKARERAQKQAAAAANRSRFGRQAPERKATEHEQAKAAREHDGHKLDEE